MRAGSTCSRRSDSPTQWVAEPVARSSPWSAGHSACHAPAARSASPLPAAVSNVATSPGTCIAAARAEMAAIGLRLCGIDDDPPAPAACSATSPTSSWARNTTSRPTLAHVAAAVPHAPATSVIHARWAWREAGATSSSNRDAKWRRISSRRGPKEAPSPLGPPSQTRWRAVRSRPPADAASPSHHRRVTVANVVGTACWPSVRAIIGDAPAVRSRSMATCDARRSWLLTTPAQRWMTTAAAASTMSWLVAARWT